MPVWRSIRPTPARPWAHLAPRARPSLASCGALSRDARIVVLDEPTASLPGPDALHLFEVLRRLRAAGTSILYVSHRLNELFGLVDRVTVLRDGRLVRSSDIGDATPESIVRDMLGRDLELHHPVRRQPAAPARRCCRSRTSSPADQGPLSFAVGQGEVVGLVGLRGAGHEAIGRTIFGAHPQTGGTIRLGPDLLPAGLADQRAHRKRNRASGRRSTGRERTERYVAAREPVSQRKQRRRRTLSRQSTDGGKRSEASDVLERFDVRPRNWAALIDWLSGGNQQKVFVGRWLATGARLFIMEEPTAGVDIGAKGVIHRILREHCG